MGVSRHRPDPQDDTYLPVTVEEIDALLAMGPRKFLRDGSRVQSLLHRFRFTLVHGQQTVRSLQRHIIAQSSQRTRAGTPTTLNPLDAVRYLDDEQKELIFDSLARERLAHLRALVTRAEEEQAVLADQLATVRDVATALTQQADLPAHVRADLARQLASLPVEPATVHHPAMLEFPDPEPPELTTSPTAPPPAHANAPDPAGDPLPAYVDPYQTGGDDTPQSTTPTFIDPYNPDESTPGTR